MAARRLIDVEHEEAKRKLRAEAARLRRRIDRDLAGASVETKRLLSWQTYVKRYPLAALAGAFGIGLAASAVISRSNWKRWVAAKLFSAAVAGVKAGVLTEVLAAWQQSRNGAAAAEPIEAGPHG
ncbi:MAG TPA: hypothetical protein VMV10_20300 [Pirellulales bacterium]|nr:hypothetical protein [Pirellulales bacterium]